MRALLIDDEAHRAQSIANILPEGIECVWVSTAALGEEQLRKEHFDLLLLDHDLYGVDGRTGQDMARIAAETQDPETCRVFIHSQNSGGMFAMSAILSKFRVTAAAWDNAKSTAAGLAEWLRETPCFQKT